HMDRLIANKMTREDWKAAARKIQETFDDEKIRNAVKQLPEEVYPLSGPQLENRLIARLDDLVDYAEQQYDLLARFVDIVGSEGEEHFEVVRNTDGTVTVTMMDKDDNIEEQETQETFYKRTFYPSETHEIRLYGLDDDDRFRISGDVKNSIRIRVVGGPDTDEYFDNSSVGGLRKKTLIYDKGDNSYQLGKESKQVNIPYTPAYNYERTHFAYNRYLPIPYLGFNNNDGFFISPGVKFTNHRYGKPDFSSTHTFRGFISTEGVRLIKYDGVHRHVLGKSDLIYGTKFADADRFAAFYGLGNETPYSQDLFDANFYNTTRSLWNVYLGLQKNRWPKSLVSARVRYESNEPEVSGDDILSLLPGLYGLERLDMVEFLFSLDLDFRDNGGLPYQGTRLVLDHNHGQVLDEGLYGVYFGALEYYETIGKGNPLTVGLRGGGSGSYGEIPFYKLTGIGQNQYLRGYQANRFVGKSMWFFNSELRYTFVNSAASFLPFKFGLKAFYDMGQVYTDDTNTDTLHRGYGGGIYFVPFKEQFTISLTAGFSVENSGLLQIAIGTPLQ
ncbi:MAG: hypothetical protein WBA74_01285, partial [Cyclobacteriaceae bacterium]